MYRTQGAKHSFPLNLTYFPDYVRNPKIPSIQFYLRLFRCWGDFQWSYCSHRCFEWLSYTRSWTWENPSCFFLRQGQWGSYRSGGLLIVLKPRMLPLILILIVLILEFESRCGEVLSLFANKYTRKGWTVESAYIACLLYTSPSPRD